MDKKSNSGIATIVIVIGILLILFFIVFPAICAKLNLTLICSLY
jgi:hypothetical protein